MGIERMHPPSYWRGSELRNSELKPTVQYTEKGEKACLRSPKTMLTSLVVLSKSEPFRT